MTSTTNPSAILADFLAQLSDAACSTFTEIENQSRTEVLRAVSEMHEARAERDKIARDLHAATLEAQGWKQEVESHRETITQLRREVCQWKDQSRNWQQHFLRVEQERCSQSSRIDELVKLQGKMATASSSQRQNPKTPTAPRTTLIRHVQAVIHVKREESGDDSGVDLATTNIIEDEASDEDNIIDGNQRRSSRRKIRKVINDDEEDVKRNYLAADEHPVERSRPLRRRNTIVNYQEEEEDDEDELMMGAEQNHEEVYGTQRVETLDAQRSKPRYPTTLVPPLSPKKKRKLAASVQLNTK